MFVTKKLIDIVKDYDTNPIICLIENLIKLF